MKISKVLALVTAVVALTSVAYAGPHNYDTFTSNLAQFGIGASVEYPLSGSPANVDLQSTVGVSDGSGGPLYSTNADYLFTAPPGNDASCDSNGENPGTFPPGDGNVCFQALPYSTDLISGGNPFGIFIQGFADQNGAMIGNDTLQSYTTGASTFFWTHDLSTDGTAPTNYSSFLEFDITIPASPAGSFSSGAPAIPAGTWRLGFGINAVNGASFSLTGVGTQDAAGNYGIDGTVNTCTEGPGCAVRVFFVDSEFDPAGSVPEPTTMLLLGSGLMVVARRFKR